MINLEKIEKLYRKAFSEEKPLSQESFIRIWENIQKGLEKYQHKGFEEKSLLLNYLSKN